MKFMERARRSLAMRIERRERNQAAHRQRHKQDNRGGRLKQLRQPYGPIMGDWERACADRSNVRVLSRNALSLMPPACLFSFLDVAALSDTLGLV